jgi:hypothetical protein
VDDAPPADLHPSIAALLTSPHTNRFI